MRKLLSIGLVVLLFSFTTGGVQAGGSPTVQIEPVTISPDGNVYITVTAVVANTTIASQNPVKVQRIIVISNPVKIFGRVLEDYYLELNSAGYCPWGPMILPDVGDEVCIRFPDAMVEVTVDEDEDVEIPGGPRGWWTAAEDPRWPRRFAPRDRLTRGTYLVVISGHEGANRFHEFYFFAVGM